MNVLIAEDDPVCRLIAQATLNRLGHRCILAEDGDAAWNLYQRHGAEVVLSDWMMPGMDGAELCRRVRSVAERRPGSPYTYFVLLTSLEDRTHFLEGMRSGADDYLLKPLDPVQLEARLLVAERVTRLHDDLHQLNRKLWGLARQDPLTGLFNRLQLGEDFALLREHVDRSGEPWSVALCDVDHFKRYNDIYGHLAGDEALRRVANMLRGVVVHKAGGKECGQATTYRYGGEEFCLLLDAPPEVALPALDLVRCSVRGLGIPHSGNPEAGGVLSLSMGLAPVLPGDGQGMDAVLQRADTALYAAKESGRDRVVLALPADDFSPMPPHGSAGGVGEKIA